MRSNKNKTNRKCFHYFISILLILFIEFGVFRHPIDKLFLIAYSNEKAIGKTTTIKNDTKSSKNLSSLVDLPVILHGLGYIDGHYVTNSREALLYNYKRGFRVFEVDLILTSDNRLVARHDWTPGHYQWLGQINPSENPATNPAEEVPIPYKDFMALKIHGRYNPMSVEQLLEILKDYPDMYFVTDTKDKDEMKVRKTFSYLVKTASQIEPKILERILPQIYEPEMLAFINDYYDFKNVILTTYQLGNLKTPEEIVNWCESNDIKAVASFPFRLSEELRIALQEKGISIYVHTVNDPVESANYRKMGLGIYTDFLFYNGKDYIGP